MSGPTQTLADFVAGLRHDDIPGDIRNRAKAYVLDNVGVALVGTRQPVYAKAAEGLRQAAGLGDAALIGSPERTSLTAAVLLNGVAIGDFEYEHVGYSSHPAASVFPAVLGLTRHLGRTGADLLTAMVAGYEIAARIGRASTAKVESERGFHNPGLNGTLAAAAAASRLLGLDREQTASALGVAASSSAGLMAFTTTGALTKRLHPGRAGQLGLEAALLAASGVTGPRDVLENPLGYFHAFSPEPAIDGLLAGLGEHWLGSDMIVKLSPVHGHALPFVYAVDALYQSGPRPDADDISSVSIVAGPNPQQPRHLNSRPASLLEAQYSVRFCIAASFVVSFAAPLAFDEQLARSGRIAALAERVTFELDPQIVRGGVITVNGADVIDARDYPSPVGPAELWRLIDEKFTSATAGLLGTAAQEAIRAEVEQIDTATDLTKLTELVAGAVARP
jgi:2-methylcitrate dehydratase PrpD